MSDQKPPLRVLRLSLLSTITAQSTASLTSPQHLLFSLPHLKNSEVEPSRCSLLSPSSSTSSKKRILLLKSSVSSELWKTSASTSARSRQESKTPETVAFSPHSSSTIFRTTSKHGAHQQSPTRRLPVRSLPYFLQLS